jgi:hypothetical protein
MTGGHAAASLQQTGAMDWRSRGGVERRKHRGPSPSSQAPVALGCLLHELQDLLELVGAGTFEEFEQEHFDRGRNRTGSSHALATQMPVSLITGGAGIGGDENALAEIEEFESGLSHADVGLNAAEDDVVDGMLVQPIPHLRGEATEREFLYGGEVGDGCGKFRGRGTKSSGVLFRDGNRQAKGLSATRKCEGLMQDTVLLPDCGQEHGLEINHDETGVGTSNAMGHGGVV